MPQASEKLKRRLYLTRDCGDCNVCCTIMPVPQLQKPAGVECKDWDKDRVGGGCKVYATRPQVCRQWACVWRSGSNLLEPEDRPDRLGIMLDTMRQIPGKPFVDAILVYETRPGGFQEAMPTIRKLALKRAVVVMADPRELIGPQDRVDRFLRDVPLEERP